jgi:hypothetical protein
MGFISSIRIARELEKISKKLEHKGMATLDDIVGGGAVRRNAAETELLDLVESLPRLQPILKKHGVNRAVLLDAYQQLLALGCGQWVRGYYVAASSLAYASTLSMVLDSVVTKKQVGLDLLSKLIEYFESGRVDQLD